MENVPRTPSIKKFTDIPASDNSIAKKKLASTCQVLSNHYSFSIPKGRAYQWIAEVTPEVEKDSREFWDMLFNIHMREITKTIGKFVRASNCLFTFDIPAENKDKKLFTFTDTNSDLREYVLTLKRQDNVISFDEIARIDDSRFQVLRVLNFFIKKLMGNLNFKEFGRDRKFYNEKLTAQVDVLGGDFTLEIMKGFKTAVEFYSSGPKLLIDCTRRIIRSYDMHAELEYFRGQNMPEERIFDEFIIGKTFMTTYGNNKMYRVTEMDNTKTPLSLFPDQSKAKTYKEYFKKQYGIDIKNTTQKLAVAEVTIKRNDGNGGVIRVTERIHLVPELLKPTGLTDDIRSDRGAMRDIAGHTQIKPDIREIAQSGILQNMNNLGPELNNLGLKIDPKSNLIKDALIFTPPTIQFRDAVTPNKDGTFIGARSKIYQKEATLGNWAIVYDKDKVDSAKATLECMKQSCKSIDVKVPEPVKIGISFFNPQTKKPLTKPEKIKAILDRLSKADPEITIFMFQFEKKIADQVYDAVKDHCHKVLGKQSQFFANISKNEDKSVITNIILQMCVKLGITIYQIQKVDGINDSNKKNSVMIVGADICHLNGRDSVVSVIATSNASHTKFYSASAFTNHRGEDLMIAVASLVQKCRENYILQNKHEPATIIFYRDGIGMGSFDEVKNKEISPILEQLRATAKSEETVPKLVYIIVNKRINDRFYVETRDGLRNPEGGLVVKSQVTNPHGFDFFMIAQKVQMGTATPTHYECLHNDSHLSSDQIYTLSYFNCFNYFNWRGPVKVPSVV